MFRTRQAGEKFIGIEFTDDALGTALFAIGADQQHGGRPENLVGAHQRLVIRIVGGDVRAQQLHAGQRLLPAYGDDNATAKNVTAPYLSISGTDDSTAPMYMMEQAVNNFRGARYQVAGMSLA